MAGLCLQMDLGMAGVRGHCGEKGPDNKKGPENRGLEAFFDFVFRPCGRAQKATSSFLRGPFSSGRLS